MQDYPTVQARKPASKQRGLFCWLFVVIGWLTGSTGYVCAGAPAKAPARPAANTVLIISITRPLTLCQGSITQIQATIPADFTRNWYWTKNGQRCSGDKETSITLKETGTYTLGGEWESDPSVTVNGAFDLTMIDQPQTTITASTVTVCAGTAFTLSATPSSASNYYEWVDSRHRFILSGPVLTTTSPDAYSLVVVSPSSCTYVAMAPLVTAYPRQTITLQADGPTAFCEGNSVQLVQAGGSLVNPVWLRNQQPLTDPYSATLTVTEGGDYTVRGDGAGCTGFPPPLSVTVGMRPSGQVVASQSIVCKGNSYELTVRPTDPTHRYVWTDGSGKVVNTNGDARLITTDEGPFNVRISTPLGCSVVLTSEGVVQFRPLTLIAIVPAQPPTLCAGASTTLTALVGNLTDYQWTRDDIPLPDGVNVPAIGVSEAGTYALTGTFPVCTQLKNRPVLRVDALPAVAIVPSSLSLCDGGRVEIAARTDASNTVHWQRDGVDAGAVRSLTANTAATYSLTATSPGGCQQTATYAFAPQRLPAPVFRLDAPEPVWPNTLAQPGNVPENPGYRYQWTPAAGASDPTSARPQLNPSVATSYTLTITDVNGCSYSDVLTLTFFTKLLVPTAFSPNGDGQNDTWTPANIDRYPNAEVFIYNRWGALVYAGRAGDAPFDGTQQGEPLPGGIYTYHIRLNIQQVEARGRLVLIR